jgi:hypothetical protein
MSLDQTLLESNIRRVLAHIEAARGRSANAADHVRLVAVTKYVGADVLPQLAAAGVETIGENRLQPAAEKHAALDGPAGLDWHFIGTIQSNKVNDILTIFSTIHSIDSLKHARDVDKRVAGQRRVPVMFEVNVAGEASKHGFTPQQLKKDFPALLRLEHLRPRGLMTMAPLVEDVELTRPVFAALRELRDELAAEQALDDFTELSMGMTNDYEIAVEEGATLVRVGSALYEGLL